jgi:Cdc6-like AAA superfamily ATPase
MADILRNVEDFCIGRAEAEQNFLVNAFVLAKNYEDALCAPLHSPIILIGRKGTGKTAFLKFLDQRFQTSGVRTLYLKPDDMPLLEGIRDAEETATIKRRAYEALISAVSTKVGAELRGLLGRKDKKLFDKAINEGIKSHDALQVCLHGLALFGSLVTHIKLEKLIPETEKPKNCALLDSLSSNFKRSDKAFVLLLDDIDQVASMVNRKQINRIWGFILAAQRLTEELPNLKTIISLRTEIWSILERDEYGQRDQVDHVRALIKRLDPSEDEIKRIIIRRLEVIRDHINLPKYPLVIEQFFEEPVMGLPTSGERRKWEDYIAKSSRGRPRDALQLLGLLAENSRKAGKLKISNEIVDKAAAIYSSQRVDDLVREYTSDCPVVREIVNSFANIEFLVPTETFKDYLITLPSRFGIIIRGATVHGESVSDIFLLWRFIHEIGIWNPRIPDTRESREFRHLLYDQQPNFVTEANWNDMQKVAWEIHPAYRSHILEIKKSEKARGGVSLSSFFKKKQQQG